MYKPKNTSVNCFSQFKYINLVKVLTWLIKYPLFFKTIVLC